MPAGIFVRVSPDTLAFIAFFVFIWCGVDFCVYFGKLGGK